MQKTGKTAAGSTTCMMTMLHVGATLTRKRTPTSSRWMLQGVEMLFLERSENGKYVKADIFDHPTAFSTIELSIAADPMEALGASLNKYGTVELDYMSSLLPDMEENDIISSLEGRDLLQPRRECL